MNVIIFTNFQMGNFKSVFIGDFKDNSLKSDLNVSLEYLITIFGSPYNVIIQIIDRCSSIR